MAIQDGHGRFCALWGEYSPKVWDGEWLRLYQPWVEACLAGTSVIGDPHFEIGGIGVVVLGKLTCRDIEQ